MRFVLMFLSNMRGGFPGILPCYSFLSSLLVFSPIVLILGLLLHVLRW